MFAKHLACVSEWSSRIFSSGCIVLMYLAETTFFLAVCLCSDASAQENSDARLIWRWQGYSTAWPVFVFTPDGTSLVSSSAQTGGPVKLWSLRDGEFQIIAEEPGSDIALSPDGNEVLLAMGRTNMAVLVDMETGVRQAEFAHPHAVWTVAFAHDSHYILTGSSETVPGQEDRVGSLRLWGSESGDLIEIIVVGGRSVEEARFSPDGDYCFVMDAYFANGPTFVKGSMWSTATWEPMYLFGREERYFGLWPIFDFSPTEPCYAVGSSITQTGSAIQILDVMDGSVKEGHLPEYDGQRLSRRLIRYFPNGTLMAIAGQEDIGLYDLESREVVCMFPFVGENPDGESVRSLAVSPTGQYLAVGRFNGYIELWDVSAFSEAGVGEEWTRYE